MAYLNKKGEIELTREDEQSLRGKKNINIDNLMNWIIWGNPQGFNNNLKNNHDKSKNN